MLSSRRGPQAGKSAIQRLSITDVTKSPADSAANLQPASHCLCWQVIEFARISTVGFAPLRTRFRCRDSSRRIWRNCRRYLPCPQLCPLFRAKRATIPRFHQPDRHAIVLRSRACRAECGRHAGKCAARPANDRSGARSHGAARAGRDARVPAARRRRLVRDLAGRIAGPAALPEARIAAPRVAQLWEAPVVRNHYEAAWFRVAGRICPEAVPQLLGEDAAARDVRDGYLDPAAYPVWKYQLRDGHADPAIAAAVGERLARIHAATAGDPAIARDFATDDSFYALRIEPYLIAAEPRASRSRAGRSAGWRETTAAHPPRAGPWRRQPEEHPDRAARAGVSRCRMRLVRRPGLRSRLLPQSPAAQMPVEPSGGRRLSGLLRPPRRDLSRRRRLGAAARRSKRARRTCCRGCCWRGSTASRRSNMSRSRPTRTGCGGSRGRCCSIRSNGSRRCARPGRQAAQE